MNRNKNAILFSIGFLAFAFQGDFAKAEIGDRIEAYEISKQAYIYAFPMLAGHKAMYEFNLDKNSSQYKGPFNTVLSFPAAIRPAGSGGCLSSGQCLLVGDHV